MDRKNEFESVKRLGEQIGYGNLMDIASAFWGVALENEYGINSRAFVPTVLPSLKKIDRKNAEMRYIAMKEHVREFMK